MPFTMVCVTAPTVCTFKLSIGTHYTVDFSYKLNRQADQTITCSNSFIKIVILLKKNRDQKGEKNTSNLNRWFDRKREQGTTETDGVIIQHKFFSFSLADSPPCDLQITADK